MRRFSLAIVILVVIALLVPSVIQAQTTSVTIQQGGGDAPFIKCKWEQQPVALNPDLEDGDPLHLTDGFQLLPPLVKCAEKPYEFYAVVTDAQGPGTVAQAFADVYHPVGSPEPYGPTSIGGVQDLEYFKYEVPFVDLQALGMTKAEAAAIVQYAYNRGLITFDPTVDLADVLFELEKDTAHLWAGYADMWYEQPAGCYDVYVYAVDKNDNLSDYLWNCFEYVPVAGIEVDFTSIDFGSVALGQEKPVPGDTVWDDPAGVNKATVRNIGNTWASVQVMFDDMGFGRDIYGNWNVLFDARMGSDDAYYVGGIEPDTIVTLSNALGLSTLDELDFSIDVLKGFGTHNGTLTLGVIGRDFVYPDIVGIPAPCP
jgi:hypothetical protein